MAEEVNTAAPSRKSRKHKRSDEPEDPDDIAGEPATKKQATDQALAETGADEKLALQLLPPSTPPADGPVNPVLLRHSRAVARYPITTGDGSVCGKLAAAANSNYYTQFDLESLAVRIENGRPEFELDKPMIGPFMKCIRVHVTESGNYLKGAEEHQCTDKFKAYYCLTAVGTKCHTDGPTHSHDDFMHTWYRDAIPLIVGQKLYTNPKLAPETHAAVMTLIKKSSEQRHSDELKSMSSRPSAKAAALQQVTTPTLEVFLTTFLTSGLIDNGLSPNPKDASDNPPDELKYKSPVFDNVFYSANEKDEEVKAEKSADATRRPMQFFMAKNQRPLTKAELSRLGNDIIAPLFNIQFYENATKKPPVLFIRPKLEGGIVYGPHKETTQVLSAVPLFDDAPEAVGSHSLTSFVATEDNDGGSVAHHDVEAEEVASDVM